MYVYRRQGILLVRIVVIQKLVLILWYSCQSDLDTCPTRNVDIIIVVMLTFYLTVSTVVTVLKSLLKIRQQVRSLLTSWTVHVMYSLAAGRQLQRRLWKHFYNARQHVKCIMLFYW